MRKISAILSLLLLTTLHLFSQEKTFNTGKKVNLKGSFLRILDADLNVLDTPDKMSFEKTKRKIVSNLIELNIGIIF